MSDSEPTELARDLDARRRLRGQFVLRSGQVSDTCLDTYLFEADPRLLARLAARMAALVPDGTDLPGGLELGGWRARAHAEPGSSCASSPTDVGSR